MWDSKQHGPGFNLYSYSNPKVDTLLDQALHTLDQEKRKQIYTDMQNSSSRTRPRIYHGLPQDARDRQQAGEESCPERGEYHDSMRISGT